MVRHDVNISAGYIGLVGRVSSSLHAANRMQFDESLSLPPPSHKLFLLEFFVMVLFPASYTPLCSEFPSACPVTKHGVSFFR